VACEALIHAGGLMYGAGKGALRTDEARRCIEFRYCIEIDS
jgi:hypothetical protein